MCLRLTYCVWFVKMLVMLGSVAPVAAFLVAITLVMLWALVAAAWAVLDAVRRRVRQITWRRGGHAVGSWAESYGWGFVQTPATRVWPGAVIAAPRATTPRHAGSPAAVCSYRQRRRLSRRGAAGIHQRGAHR
jgi:hypothetical protein